MTTPISTVINNPSILDPNDDFDKLLLEIKNLNNKKKADYSNPGNRFSNFEYAANFAGLKPEQIFEVLLGIKQARLIELRGSGKTPQNESVRDTLLDRSVYSLLALLFNDRDSK